MYGLIQTAHALFYLFQFPFGHGTFRLYVLLLVLAWSNPHSITHQHLQLAVITYSHFPYQKFSRHKQSTQRAYATLRKQI
ncbi:hypothetical protein BJL68_09455 [Staphylococcus aureus]|nr:hypothetical protein BJL68_09455 [Staphylococcus aureus]